MIKVKLAQHIKTTVRCDEKGCNWKKEIPNDELIHWFNIKCPDCKICIIINRDDLKQWIDMQELFDVEVETDEEKPERVRVSVDTKTLRD